MKLFTKQNLKDLHPLYSQEGKGEEAKAIVKFFTPFSNLSWFAIEYNPETKEFFGLVKGQDTELGYFSLTEFENYNKTKRVGIERDMYFEPKTIKEIKEGL